MIIKDDRFYHVDGKHYPRVTWILGNGCPTPEPLLKWYAANGWEEGQRLMHKAGDAGTRIHTAIENLLEGSKLTVEAFSIEEWEKITGFTNWYNTWQPDESISLETRVVYEDEDIRYAGTFDALMKKDGELHILDWKSSSGIRKKYWLQAAAYAHAYEAEHDVEVDFTGVLQVNQTKQGYMFKERNRKQWQEDYKVFEHVWHVAAHFASLDKPKDKEVEDELKL